MSSKRRYFFNGIGEDGDYAIPAMDNEAICEVLRDHSPTLSYLGKRMLGARQTRLDTVPWVDPRDLGQTGWGIVFPGSKHLQSEVQNLKDQLALLLSLRQTQAGNRFKCFEGEAGYQPGERVDSWLARHGSGRGPVDPERVPYYLLLVGSPEEIPYEWQFQLDIQFAVGRIHFDRLSDYANYAESVVSWSNNPKPRPRRLAVFAPTHEKDRLCKLSRDRLARPVFEGAARNTGWERVAYYDREANKDRLHELLSENPPALLFYAGHAFSCKRATAAHDSRQGALVCGNWRGPKLEPIETSHYYSADDVKAPAPGLVAFLFGCHTAGTPKQNPYWREPKQTREPGDYPSFVAPLARALLAQPGGALACIGHIEQAWPLSFQSEEVSYATHFQGVVHRLLEGYPVGAAMEGFNQRHAEAAAALAGELELLELGAERDTDYLARLWTSYIDARAYAVVGDPAVTLNIERT